MALGTAEKAVIAGLIGSGAVLHLSGTASVPNIPVGHFLEIINNQKQWSVGHHIDEQLLLQKLVGQKGDLVVLLEGLAGSGKSHLIRWLSVSWPKRDQDLLYFIPKVRNSLWETIELLKPVRS